MGNNVRTMSRTELSDELTKSINNHINNLNKIFTEIIMKTTTNFVSQEVQKVTIMESQRPGRAQIGNINLDGNINIAQQEKLKREEQAIWNIINNKSILEKMALTIHDELLNKTKTDRAMIELLEKLNALKEVRRSGGGPEAIVDVVQNIIKKSSYIAGNNLRDQNETLITNKLMSQLTMKLHINYLNISNIIKNNTSSMVKNIQENTCGFDRSSMILGNINANSQNKLKLSQNLDITAFNKCVLIACNPLKMITEITEFNFSKPVPNKPPAPVYDKDGYEDITCKVALNYGGCNNREKFTNVMNVTKDDNCDNIISILCMFAIFFLLFSIIKRKI